ncbi:MAG: hypothetical protein ACOC3I_03725 [Verrucomicrobiota bacterium]
MTPTTRWTRWADALHEPPCRGAATLLDMLFATSEIRLCAFLPLAGRDPARTGGKLPAGDPSRLHALAPIGTQFTIADEQGPAEQPRDPACGGQTSPAAACPRAGETTPSER